MSEYCPDAATARQDLFRFLSACYYEPAPAFAEESLFDSIVTAAACLDADLAASARELRDAFDADNLEPLLVDYTRLFLGPIDVLASPYGSFWQPVPAPADELAPPAVLALYSEGGFDIDDEFQDLPDHVAVELEFLYLLAFTQNQAQQARDSEALAASQGLQQRFLAEHLGMWIVPFAAAVRARAETAFYRSLAALTERWVLLQMDLPRRH